MAKITITIDGDNVTVNQSAAPTKVETSTIKRYFIVIGHYGDSSWVELITEDYIDAVNRLKDLRHSCKDNNYSYTLSMQEDRKVIPCNGTDWDIDR